jgi:hypothetical protein
MNPYELSEEEEKQPSSRYTLHSITESEGRKSTIIASPPVLGKQYSGVLSGRMSQSGNELTASPMKKRYNQLPFCEAPHTEFQPENLRKVKPPLGGTE